MNRFEFAELSASAMSNFLATFSVFLSVATAYLVAAYLVGKKLTTLQLSIVNGSYLISFQYWATLSRQISEFSIFGQVRILKVQ